MIVTIDGPAGAGKSTVSRLLAAELGFRFLDTGSMYRAITWAALDRQVPLDDHAGLAALAGAVTIVVTDQGLTVDGADVTRAIRDPTVTRNIGPVADNPEVRRVMVELQRRIASDGDYVCEGRDQGTVAFPNAECKIYLTASPEHRAQRRVGDLAERGLSGDYETILEEQMARDFRDQNRAVGRLQQAPDAIVVDTDNLSVDEVVQKLKQIVQTKIAGRKS
ncbi:MAG: (d)CMP kinase [Pirellulaceae bacterium]|nr:(d)CMP kinase [Pirellulaceae bacterium]